MPSIFPFKAFRARPDLVERFSEPAYDSDIKAEVFISARQEPISFLHILRPGDITGRDLSQEESIALSHEKFSELEGEGVIVQDKEASIYIYRQVKSNHTYTGIIALASIQDYKDGKIKKHELTRTEKEKAIAGFFREIRMNGSPVLLTHEDSSDLNSIIGELIEAAPEYNFSSPSHIEHMLWPVSNTETISRLEAVYDAMDAFYIADGHHRCAASSYLDKETDGFMTCLIPASQLRIESFHRLVKDLNELGEEEFIGMLKSHFDVSPLEVPTLPDSPGVIHLLFKTAAWKLTIPQKYREVPNPKSRLDVSILEKVIIKTILHIDGQTSDRITYLNEPENISDILAFIESGEMQAAFLLFPMGIRDVIAISDLGDTLPPKSTWMEPKLRSGLIVHKF